MVNTGNIQLILGPMFSGKTSELVRRIRRESIANNRCILIKHESDVRYDEHDVVTHDKQKYEAVACRELRLVEEVINIDEYNVIGIDEGQFFPDIVEFAEKMANDNKCVIIASLDGTFERKPFGDILRLIPFAEDVVKLTAVCMVCKRTASFSLRVGTEKEVEVIGGQDKYMAVCRKCYITYSSAASHD